MRILIAGSRNWENRKIIHTKIQELHQTWQESGSLEPFTIVHGDCQTGADAMADQIATFLEGAVVEKHPYWGEYGRAGGPLRNRHMASLGADAVRIFIRNSSNGASNMLLEARKAGLPDIQVIREDWYNTKE